jgi:hypothetical protein
MHETDPDYGRFPESDWKPGGEGGRRHLNLPKSALALPLRSLIFYNESD